MKQANWRIEVMRIPLGLLCLGLLLSFIFLPIRQQAAARVTVTEYADFQCSYCKRAASVATRIRAYYGDRVRFVFKQMPLKMHQRAFKAAQASFCAGEQGKFWEYHDSLFAAADLSPDEINRLALTVGLSQTAFSKCLSSERSKAEVEQDVAEATRLGVTGTPTFFVNGQMIRGAATFAALQKAIDGAMTGQPPPRLKSSGKQDSTFVRDAWSIPVEIGAPKNRVAHAGVALSADFMPVNRQAPSNTTATGVTLSPASVDLGYQLVGTMGPRGDVTVTNSTATPLVISDLSVSGRDRGYFKLSYGFNLPFTVAPADSITVGISFIPTAVGVRNATLEISEKKVSQYVPLTGKASTCVGPFPSCASGCPASDGDGLNDAWKLAGGIDFNGDGLVDQTEKVFTNVNPMFPDGTPNAHPSAERGVKDVFVLYDWMELPDQLTNGQPTVCTINPPPQSGPPNKWDLEYPNHSDQCAFDEACINGICRGHSDAPDPAALMKVIEAFAAHNIHLHLIGGHALPHSNVIGWGRPAAACIADTSGLTFAGSQAAGFYDLKTANFNAAYNQQSFEAAQLFLFMHYAVFAHRTACDSRVDCPQPECFDPDIGQNPPFDDSGLSEQPGNDIIVSLGFFQDIQIRPPPPLVAGGTFMHELGHNLGLLHGGPIFTITNPADYMSGYTANDPNQV